MRWLAILLIAATPAWAIDPLRVGEQIETINVPNIFPCREAAECTALWYSIRHSVPVCLRYEDIKVARLDGSPVPHVVDESGEPGEAGYNLDIKTTGEVSGWMTVHVRVVSTCPPKVS